MHTEDQAKLMWCPHARREIVGDNDCSASANRDWNDRATTNCYGSDCMAWRWGEWYGRGESIAYLGADRYERESEPERPAEVSADHEWVPPEDGDPGCWVLSDAARAKLRRGYCGLSGTQNFTR